MNKNRENSRKAIRTVLAPSMYSKMLVLPNSACVCCNCVKRCLKELACDIRSGYYDDAYSPFAVLDMSMVDGGVHCDKCGDLINDYEQVQQATSDSVACCTHL